MARLGKVARKPGRFKRDFSPRREVSKCRAIGTLAYARMARLSEVAMTLGVFLWNLRPSEELCVLNDLRSRSGEKSSPKRDEVIHPLLHTRLGEVV